MRGRILFPVCTLAAFWAVQSVAEASGGMDSGGGMVVACRDPAGTLLSAELLDVYEAKLDTARKLMTSTGDFERDYLEMGYNVGRLVDPNFKPDPSMDEQAAASLEWIMSQVRWVSLPDELPFLNDQGQSPILPDGCRLEQLAIFKDDVNSVLIQKELWDHIDSLNRAALIRHEYYYMLERRFQEKDSMGARAYVRESLALSGYTPTWEGALPAEFKCTGNSYGASSPGDGNYTVFYVHEMPAKSTGQSVLELQFEQLGGHVLLVKAVVEIPGAEFNPRPFHQGGMQVMVPEQADAHTSEELPVITEHRPDWRLQFSYVAGEPITFTLIEDGQAQPIVYLMECNSTNGVPIRNGDLNER